MLDCTGCSGTAWDPVKPALAEAILADSWLCPGSLSVILVGVDPLFASDELPAEAWRSCPGLA
jgi:hypothetical protein